jgi:hypothetical protein
MAKGRRMCYAGRRELSPTGRAAAPRRGLRRMHRDVLRLAERRCVLARATPVHSCCARDQFRRPPPALDSLLPLWTSRSVASLAGRSRMRARRCRAWFCRWPAVRLPRATRVQQGRTTATLGRPPNSRYPGHPSRPGIAWPLQFALGSAIRAHARETTSEPVALRTGSALRPVTAIGPARSEVRGRAGAGAARNSSTAARNGFSAAENARNRRAARRYLGSLCRICGGHRAAGARIGTGILRSAPS